MTADQAYDALRKEMYEIALLRATAGLLSWDEQTHLPTRGTPFRAEQMALFGKMAHERFTAKKVGDLIAAVEADPGDSDGDRAANARELRRDYDRATKVPSSLVEELARQETLGQAAWVEARKAKDYARFAPHLAKTVELKKRYADCVGFANHPYEGLLEDFEPRETMAGVRAVLEGMRDQLVPLVRKVAASGKRPKKLTGPFPVGNQEAFGKLAAEKIGFDFTAGRLDTSVHPFCTGLAPGDTRITTRYRETDIADALFGVLHEVGHALYEQGLPKAESMGLPTAEAVSLGIHESQSRMWENLVGRSRAFWQFFGPTAREHLPALNGLSEDELLFVVNEVEPGFIRVEADEVTYNLHVLLRFEVESALVGGELGVDDVPTAWDERMRKYLGVTPPDAAMGCLQDIHWSAGLMGYFPTYTLGNLYAAQFFERARKDLGDLDAMFARGEFRPLLDWLRQNIHRHGRKYSARQLVKRITGRDLDAGPLVAHLTSKVDEFYG